MHLLFTKDFKDSISTLYRYNFDILHLLVTEGEYDTPNRERMLASLKRRAVKYTFAVPSLTRHYI